MAKMANKPRPCSEESNKVEMSRSCECLELFPSRLPEVIFVVEDVVS